MEYFTVLVVPRLSELPVHRLPTGPVRIFPRHGFVICPRRLADAVQSRLADLGVASAEMSAFPDKDRTYVNLLAALLDLADRHVAAINLSLFLRAAPGDPVPTVLRRVLAGHSCVVCAIGNKGKRRNALNPLAALPGMISVGAVDEEGRLLRRSSRDEKTGGGPTVVALGSPNYPPAVLEAHPELRRLGLSTSFATPKVARLAGMIKLILHHGENIVRALNGSPLRPLLLPDLRILDTEDLINPFVLRQYPDYIRTIVDQQDNRILIRPAAVELRAFRAAYAYLQRKGLGPLTVSDRPATVKRVLIATATVPPAPGPGYGAGIVDYSSAAAYFRNAGLPEFLTLFGPPRGEVPLPSSAECEQIGPIFHPVHIDSLCRIGFNAIMYPTKITH